jgi:methyl-accepting chemotaxis protein
MDKMTQQNAAMVEQSTAAARSLADEANRLATLVNQFALGQQTSGHKNPAAAKPAPRGNRQAQPRTAGNLAIAVNEEDWTEF